MTTPYTAPVLRWYAASARDLPWRRADATPWSILVSEIMLQQTPVSRVLPAHAAWLRRWPEPAALAAATPGRRGPPVGPARLPAPRGPAARERRADHEPARRPGAGLGRELLRSLPGVGSYTAAAVASFAFGQRHAVLDTNVRRVLARLVTGESPAAAGADRGGDPACRVAAAAGRQGRRSVVGRRDGTRRAGLHSGAARAVMSARSRGQCAWLRRGPARPPRRRRPPLATRAATGSAAAGCWPSCGAASGPVPAAAWSGLARLRAASARARCADR